MKPRQDDVQTLGSVKIGMRFEPASSLPMLLSFWDFCEYFWFFPFFPENTVEKCMLALVLELNPTCMHVSIIRAIR